MIQLIIFLRKLSVKVKKWPGSIVILNLVRRVFIRKAISVRVDDFDGNLSMNLRLDEHMQSQIFWYGAYSRDILLVIKNLLKPGMVVVDAGANVGEITLVSAKQVGTLGHVYAFEPLVETAEKLSRNVQLNEFQNVHIQRCGLAENSGFGSIYRSSSRFDDGSVHDGLATLYPSSLRNSKVGEIELVSLDDFCVRTGIEKLNLVKIDIEGAELSALKGAVQSLRKFNPFLIIEVQGPTARQAGYEPRDILSFLRPMGYSFRTIGRLGRLNPVDADSLKGFQNILCTPGASG